MALQLNLEKSRAALKLCLEKAGVVKAPVMDMGVALDVSGSFEDEHEDGTTNALVARLVPWGLTFDPDGKLDLATFSDGPGHVQMVESVTAANYVDFVARHVIGKVKGWNGGTTYSYVIERFLQEFGWIEVKAPKPGFLAKLFGAADPVQAPAARRRSLVVMITDGDNVESDCPRTRHVLAQSQERQDEVFFLYLAVSNQGGAFKFLHQLDDAYRNSGLVVIKNIQQFVALSDDELNEMLLLPKLISWLKN